MMCERQETKYGPRMGAKQLKPVILSESERRRSEDESKDPDNDCRMNTALGHSHHAVRVCHGHGTSEEYVTRTRLECSK
jgi:hypothetical protein